MFRKLYKEANDEIAVNKELMEHLKQEAVSGKTKKKYSFIYNYGYVAAAIIIVAVSLNVFSDIEKGIYEANIGLTPNNNGECIILNIPALTEETRKGYVKEVKQMAEDCKINLRNIRQDFNNDVRRNDDFTDDEKDNKMDDIQDLINKYNKIVDEKLKEKEKDLLSV